MNKLYKKNKNYNCNMYILTLEKKIIMDMKSCAL